MVVKPTPLWPYHNHSGVVFKNHHPKKYKKSSRNSIIMALSKPQAEWAEKL
jgi:hypothetical protein